MVDVDMVDVDMVDMDMVDVDMVDMVKRIFLVNFIYLEVYQGSLPTVCLFVCFVYLCICANAMMMVMIMKPLS